MLRVCCVSAWVCDVRVGSSRSKCSATWTELVAMEHLPH